MTNPIIVNRYNKTVEIWNDEIYRYVKFTHSAIKDAEVFITDTVDHEGVVYRTEPPPPPEEEKEPTEQELKDLGFSRCEQCDELAWDGRICHACGMKEI